MYKIKLHQKFLTRALTFGSFRLCLLNLESNSGSEFHFRIWAYISNSSLHFRVRAKIRAQNLERYNFDRPCQTWLTGQ